MPSGITPGHFPLFVADLHLYVPFRQFRAFNHHVLYDGYGAISVQYDPFTVPAEYISVIRFSKTKLSHIPVIVFPGIFAKHRFFCNVGSVVSVLDGFIHLFIIHIPYRKDILLRSHIDDKGQRFPVAIVSGYRIDSVLIFNDNLVFLNHLIQDHFLIVIRQFCFSAFLKPFPEIIKRQSLCRCRHRSGDQDTQQHDDQDRACR